MTPEWFSRREMLRRCGLGLGGMALAHLVHADRLRAAPAHDGTFNDLRPRPGHFPGRARAEIQLYQEGGPSQVDLLDPKPDLTKHDGQPHPQGVRGPSPSNKSILMGSPYEFRRFGRCGMELSELLPHLGDVADELCLVRSMYTD